MEVNYLSRLGIKYKNFFFNNHQHFWAGLTFQLFLAKEQVGGKVVSLLFVRLELFHALHWKSTFLTLPTYFQFVLVIMILPRKGNFLNKTREAHTTCNDVSPSVTGPRMCQNIKKLLIFEPLNNLIYHNKIILVANLINAVGS